MPSRATTPDTQPEPGTPLAMSGLDYLREMLSGAMPASPISVLLNFHPDSAEEGRVTFRGTPLFDHTNPFGGVHGGWYGTVLDTVMGCAVMSAMPAGRRYTTLEFKVNILRALPLGTEMVATGLLDHAGRSTAVAHGEIRGAGDGKLYATGSTTCLVLG